jgi:LacI family transcriptional regulator
MLQLAAPPTAIIALGTLVTLELMYPPATAFRYNHQRSARAVVELMTKKIRGDAPPAGREIMVP